MLYRALSSDDAPLVIGANTFTQLKLDLSDLFSVDDVLPLRTWLAQIVFDLPLPVADEEASVKKVRMMPENHEDNDCDAEIFASTNEAKQHVITTRAPAHGETPQHARLSGATRLAGITSELLHERESGHGVQSGIALPQSNVRNSTVHFVDDALNLSLKSLNGSAVTSSHSFTSSSTSPPPVAPLHEPAQVMLQNPEWVPVQGGHIDYADDGVWMRVEAVAGAEPLASLPMALDNYGRDGINPSRKAPLWNRGDVVDRGERGHGGESAGGDRNNASDEDSEVSNGSQSCSNIEPRATRGRAKTPLRRTRGGVRRGGGGSDGGDGGKPRRHG
jgi:hypothetical protein